MSEIIAAFCTRKCPYESTDAPVEGTNGPFGKLSQKGFEFAERQLNWVEVWRVSGQIFKSCAASFDCLLHASNFVHPTVVHHNDVISPESWTQALLDITQECWPVHGTVNNHRRRHPIMPQPGNAGDGFPFSLRNMTD